MAHPFASQAKASQKRRLGVLGAKAGKSFGSSSMYKKTSYPGKGAGTTRELTIEGGNAKKRADRFASGGFVGGGSKKKSKKGHSTTNIVIASPGGGQGPQAVPVPKPVPIPVPVGGGGLPPPRPPSALPPGGAGPGIGGPPVNVNVPPPAAAPPVPGRPPGLADGGTIKGSTYHNWGKGYKFGGSVKKKANGGPVGGGGGYRGRGPQDDEDDRPPINPMTFFGGGGGGGMFGGGGGDLSGIMPDASAAAPIGGGGGGMRMKKGGVIKKRQFGGGAGQPGLGPQLAGPRKPFAPGAVPGQRPGAKPPVVPLTGGRPTRPGYKKGGVAHDDEAQDKKLIAKMIKKSKKADGGAIKKFADGGGDYSATDDEPTPQASSTSSSSPAAKGGGLSGVMKALTGVDKALNPSATKTFGEKSALGAQNAAEATGRAVAGSTQALARGNQTAGFKPAAVPGGGGGFKIAKDGGAIKKLKAGGDVTGEFTRAEEDKIGASAMRGGKYENDPHERANRKTLFEPMGTDAGWNAAIEKDKRGTHYRKGGSVKAGSHSGLGRLQKISAAKKVPAKTEV